MEARGHAAVELRPGKAGQFDIVIDGKLAYSRYETGRFPWESDLSAMNL